MTNQYELVVLLHPDLEMDADTTIAKIESLVQAVNGKVIKRDNWGKKRLAYRINKLDFAVYMYFELELDVTSVRELENTILIAEEVIRHILVIHEDFAPKATARKVQKDDTTSESSKATTEEPKKASDKSTDVSATEGD